MKRFRILAILLTVVAASSCIFEEKNYFDESSAQRVQNGMKECKSVLAAAPNGWVMECYPDPNLTYGGYNAYLQFTEDGKVIAMSEITEDPEASAESYYTLKQSAGVVLSFDTYNEVFSLFADPVGPAGATGDGMLGDYDFLVMSASAEEVVLKGKKSGNYSVLRPLEGSWADYLEKLTAAEEHISGTFKIDVQGNTVEVSGSYRNFVLSYTNEDGESVQEYAPYIITPSGASLYEPVTLFGQEFTTVSYSAGSDNLTTDNSAVNFTAVVVPIAEQLVKNAWSLTYDNLSDWAKAQFDKTDSILLSQEGENMLYMFLCPGSFLTSDYKSTWGICFITDAGYAGELAISSEIGENDTVKLTYSPAGNQGNGDWYYNNCQFVNYLNVIAPAAGKTFQLTTDSLKRPSYVLLTEVGNPDNWIKLLATEETYK